MTLNGRILSGRAFTQAAGEEDDVASVESLETTAAVRTTDISALSTVSTVADKYGFLRVEHDATHELAEEHLPLEVRRRRELKWVSMLQRWDHYMTTNYSKVRSRCRKGIPSSVRERAWSHLCGGAYLLAKNAGLFERLADGVIDENVNEQIVKDLHRQFPLHEMFARDDGPGQRELLRVLRAYVAYRPQDGYSQAQAPIASVLLMHMPAELAFWSLVSICEKYLPAYYGPSMDAVILDGQVLHNLLKRVAPHIYRHVKKLQLDPSLYVVEWFMCIYSRTLPWASVLRVWDMFFCEGVKVMFAVALVLVRYTLGRRGVLKRCTSLYDIVELLHSLPPEITHERVLVSQMLELNLDQATITEEYRRHIRKQRKLARKTEKEQLRRHQSIFRR